MKSHSEIRANQVKIKPQNGGDATCRSNESREDLKDSSKKTPTYQGELANASSRQSNAAQDVQAGSAATNGINDARQHIMRSVNLRISKADVVLEIANAILRLGKNDWDGVLISLRRAEFLFKDWRKQSIQEGFHKK